MEKKKEALMKDFVDADVPTTEHDETAKTKSNEKSRQNKTDPNLILVADNSVRPSQNPSAKEGEGDGE